MVSGSGDGSGDGGGTRKGLNKVFLKAELAGLGSWRVGAGGRRGYREGRAEDEEGQVWGSDSCRLTGVGDTALGGQGGSRGAERATKCG